MGAMDVLYSYGFKYENPNNPYEMEGFVNSEASVAGLEFYKALYDCCTPPGASNSYMGEGIDAFKSGQVALHMNFAFTWPGLYKDPNVGGDKIGFFVNTLAVRVRLNDDPPISVLLERVKQTIRH
jgi:multiple sugar transport system substrate-binding protein